MEQGRLLLVSPFPPAATWVSAESAQVRNRIVCTMAQQILVAHADPGSKTAHLAEEIAVWGKPLWAVEHLANQNLQTIGFLPYPARQ